MNTRLTFHQWREWTHINQTFSLSQTCFSLHSRHCGGQLISGGFGNACIAMWSTKREKGDPSFFSVLPCSWQSRALVNSGGKRGAEWSWRSGARSCRELPAPLYLPGRKERPAAAAEPFSLTSIETLWKEPGKVSWIQREKVRNGS